MLVVAKRRSRLVGAGWDSHLFMLTGIAAVVKIAVMPRVARIVVPGCPHHVTPCGNND